MVSVGKKLQKSTNGNTTLNKENIVGLIKAVFFLIKEFQKQQQEISKVISNNRTITKQETGKLREKFNDLKNK